MFNDYKMNGPLVHLLTPNERASTQAQWYTALAWIFIAVSVWEIWRSPIFPSVTDIIAAFPELWFRDGLGDALISSFRVNIEALLLSTAFSLPVAYLSGVPFFHPPAVALSKLRFLSPAVFFLVLLFVSPSAHALKVLMLAAGEAFFLITTMVGVVGTIPLAKFDDARTLRMNEWQVTWYVVVRGTLSEALEAIRGNAAQGWGMVIMVEGFIRSEGGVGILLLNQEKYMNFSSVYAIALSILGVGVCQDYAINAFRRGVCPYTEKA